MKTWTCKIGETDFNQHGMDLPMRRAVRKAYIEITGKEPTFIFSGWGGELSAIEREIVDEQAEASRKVNGEKEADVCTRCRGSKKVLKLSPTSSDESGRFDPCPNCCGAGR